MELMYAVYKNIFGENMRKKLFHFMFILGIMEGMLNAVPAKGDLGKI